MPCFSIVVPAYNAESTLAETLDAILGQEFADWECIVVDDGSVDGTRALAESYASRDTRVRTVSQPNQGSGGAYNTGVRVAKGRFVVLCSADDVLLPGYLREMDAFIASEAGFDIYSSNGYFWRAEDDSRELVYAAGVRDEVMSLTLADVVALCFYSVGAAYRRELFDLVGGYRVDVFGEDYDFWLRALAAGARHRYLPKALSLHRVSPTQKSANLERAYRSDIRLITDLMQSADLTDEEIAVARESIRRREQLIEELGASSPGERVRSVLRSAAWALLGRSRTERLVKSIRSRGVGGSSRDD